VIGRLRGTLVVVGGTGVVIDVGGVGYEVALTAAALGDLPPTGEEAVIHTHLHVREDQMSLFGFTSQDQRDLFRLLIGVSGVGPKVAMAILGTMTTDDLRQAVATDDVAALTAVPGIGKRSAQKLLLELRPRLELSDAIVGSSGAMAETRAALEGLGYQPDEIRAAMRELSADLPVEELLRRSLQQLGRGEGP
jgi:Holliday junction DNA helicase RuvA